MFICQGGVVVKLCPYRGDGELPAPRHSQHRTTAQPSLSTSQDV